MSDLSELLRLASRSVVDRHHALTLPGALFMNRPWFEAERELMYAGWVAVGRSSDVAEGGSFLTADVIGEPVVVVRARDGALRALSNVCRHRAVTIVEGRGSTPSLQCPYHLWTYRLDGHLAAAPSMAGAADFDPSTVCLPEFAVTEWHGWVLVNIDRGAPAPAEAHTALDRMLAEHRLSEMVTVGQLSYPSPWNWKVSVENFLESYHHRGVHPETLETTFPGVRSFAPEPGDEPWAAVDHVSVIEGVEPFLAVVVFRTLMFAILRDVGLAWFHLEPVSVDHCHLTIEIMALPELASDAELVRELVAGTAAINEEDVPINRRTMAGLRSRFAEPSPISDLEVATWRFRRWLVEGVNAVTTGRPS